MIMGPAGAGVGLMFFTARRKGVNNKRTRAYLLRVCGRGGLSLRAVTKATGFAETTWGEPSLVVSSLLHSLGEGEPKSITIMDKLLPTEPILTTKRNFVNPKGQIPFFTPVCTIRGNRHAI